jgi:hypothetical protein
VIDSERKADHVFTLRFLRETAFEHANAKHWRVRVRHYVDDNLLKEHHVDGVENAFAVVRASLMTEGNAT